MLKRFILGYYKLSGAPIRLVKNVRLINPILKPS